MKVEINQILKGINGVEPIIDNGKTLTLRELCIASVLTPVQEDDQRKKFGKWEIFKKLRDADEFVDLTSEEITIIKEGSGKIHPPLLYGQLYEMLEK